MNRLKWWWADVRHYTQSRFHMTLAITGWTCHHGLHRFAFDPECGKSWSHPGEPGWGCVYCGDSGYPYRYAVSDWFWTHIPLRWVAEWRINRDWERYIHSDEVEA